MDAVKDDVIKLVSKELKSANEKFPLFSSPHEGYAVIKEEVEEAQDNMSWCIEKLGCIWEDIKHNDNAEIESNWLKEFAIDGACELIQVAAMAQKFMDSQDKE
jgi:hypothetical protein